MLQSLMAAWGARRVLLLGSGDRMTRFMRGLLVELGARPLCLPLPCSSETLARTLSAGRFCCVIVPCLRALSGGLISQLQALDALLIEAREAGVPLVMLLCDESAYRAAQRPWAVREDDPIGGETREGLFQAILQLFADGVSRGLLGDPVHVLTVRHLPCLGCGHPAVAPYDLWCHALDAGEPLIVPHPGAQGVFLHPLDVCMGSLLLGARFLLGDTACTGVFNLEAGAQNLMPGRTAALHLSACCGHGRALRETEPPHPVLLPLLDGSRARRLCSAHPVIPGHEALLDLLTLSRAQQKGPEALEEAIAAQTAAFLSRFLS
ncbi:MAG: hypothetical protein ACI4MM_08360 [Candidatus Ventricola sp.]